ncbi:hypothetical protein VTN31DRAFT_3365 [Thermomyces dupontii]|uniref:uncharacterized protein n=1 Tax=Talaromyces thermophilus TaxID=28565 RepID=UPI00374324E4
MSSDATPISTQPQPQPQPQPDLNRSTPNPQVGEQQQTSQQQQQQTLVAGGAPARVYMNEKIVPYLLEGMKAVAKEQPSNPLRVLGEFLIQKSNEVESRGNQS